MQTHRDTLRLFSLRAQKSFPQDYWLSLIESWPDVGRIVLVGFADSLRRSTLLSHAETSRDSIILAPSALREKRTSKNLMGLAWYGAPFRVVFCSDDESQIELLKQCYEAETWDDASEFLLQEAEPWLEAARSALLAPARYQWSFGPDADYAVLRGDSP